MTSLNLVRAPLRTTPFVIEPPRLRPEAHPRSPLNSTERMAVLLRHREILLQEVHHRVGNSLQIIASILSLDASQVHSEEARRTLERAHRRILAVATLQRQLQISRRSEDLELSRYLHQLCENLAASLIGTTKRIAIDVHADFGRVSSDEALTIGLVVTELVINALKYAVTADKITVTYHADSHNWRLTVSDNGVGKSDSHPDPAATGLGTKIIAALVRQLDGHIQTSTGVNGPGISVSITGGKLGSGLARA